MIAGRTPPGDGVAARPRLARPAARGVAAQPRPGRRARLLAAAGVADDLHDERDRASPTATRWRSRCCSTSSRSAEGAPLELDAVPDVVERLVTCFVAEVPSPRHRLALESWPTPRVATEGLLARGHRRRRGRGDVRLAARRSRSSSWAREGLVLHDLAREAIDADLRWRDRAAYTRVHGLVRRDVVERLLTCEGREHQRALADLMFLHRGNPAAPAFWDWESLGEVYADALRPGDEEAVLAMVERHEGAESRGDRGATGSGASPRRFDVVRGREPEPLGFLAQPAAARGVARRTSRQDPGRGRGLGPRPSSTPPRGPARRCWCGRFYMDRDAYQAPSRSFNVVTMRSTQEWLERPRLSWYYIASARPRRARAADGVHRLRRARRRPTSRSAGGATASSRATGAARTRWPGSSGWTSASWAPSRRRPPRRRRRRPSVALSQPEFADAVRRALRDLHRPRRRWRPIRSCARASSATRAAAPAAEALRALLEQAVGALRADPRDAKLAARPRPHLPAARRPPRRRPRSCSGCPSAPTAAT